MSGFYSLTEKKKNGFKAAFPYYQIREDSNLGSFSISRRCLRNKLWRVLHSPQDLSLCQLPSKHSKFDFYCFKSQISVRTVQHSDKLRVGSSPLWLHQSFTTGRLGQKEIKCLKLIPSITNFQTGLFRCPKRVLQAWGYWVGGFVMQVWFSWGLRKYIYLFIYLLTDTCKAPVTPWGTRRWQEQVITPQSHSSGDNFSPGEVPGFSCLSWSSPAGVASTDFHPPWSGISTRGGQRGVKAICTLISRRAWWKGRVKS